MKLTSKVSHADKFKEIKNFYESHAPYNGWEMDCADLFRDYEWMLTDDADYAKHTYQELLAGSNDVKFKVFLNDVIGSMKYNLSQIED